VGLSVQENDLTIYHRLFGEYAARQCVADTGFDGRDELAGDGTAYDLVLKQYAAA
jgi:hypothetical protein